ncbi:hypothetical protein ACIBED_13260 [Rhodococcus coprophilus]|uniref:Uncharacterized protein n=1 Tax=Rhodococcus coprophilus TaxID=38310 RepID=A0A2X4U9D5_9NOCA|nr:hypothetical protein [Rhodococcus coprophilus]MBM7459530.1 hypothetical protein [Rhodococcus coprophilus]SQI36416.1 Uncharacterised protein [Rhodococcus coprophilus]
MANGGPQRVEVRLAVEYPGPGAVDTLGSGAMTPIEPVPPICARHGEPEVDRVRVTVSSDASWPEQKSGRLGSALEAAYTVQVAAVEWPACARCVAVRVRWQIAAAATCTVLGVVFLALVFALVQGAPKVYGFALLAVFGLSFLPIYVALRVIEPRAALGMAVADDGAHLVVSRAHPEFARAVAAQGT